MTGIAVVVGILLQGRVSDDSKEWLVRFLFSASIAAAAMIFGVAYFATSEAESY